ncbi:MAG: F0F1 ATP synthase subunit B' [Alphaproteobacteria bacterium]
MGFLFALIATLSMVSAAFAAETATEGHSGGLPQLNPASFTSQIFWLFVIFIVLYVVLARIALPRIGAVIEARQQKITGDLAKATAAKDQAASVLAAYEAELAAARDKAQATMQAALDHAQTVDRDKQHHLAESLARDVNDAEAQIITAKKEAMAGIRKVAVEIAIAITQRLSGEKPDTAKVEAAIASVATKVQR